MSVYTKTCCSLREPAACSPLASSWLPSLHSFTLNHWAAVWRCWCKMSFQITTKHYGVKMLFLMIISWSVSPNIINTNASMMLLVLKRYFILYSLRKRKSLLALNHSGVRAFCRELKAPPPGCVRKKQAVNMTGAIYSSFNNWELDAPLYQFTHRLWTEKGNTDGFIGPCVGSTRGRQTVAKTTSSSIRGVDTWGWAEKEANVCVTWLSGKNLNEFLVWL